MPVTHTLDPHRWAGSIYVLVAIAMTTMDSSIVNVTLPTIERDLEADPAQLQWISVIYTLGFALFLVTAGRIGDIAGRKRMVLLGIGGFVIASAICAFAPNIAILLAGRALQGLTGAVITTLALSVFQVSFPPEERSKVFGLFGAVGGISAALGPSLGGLLVHADLMGLSWRPIFLVNLPIGLVTFIGAALYVRESRSERPLSLDLGGVLLLTVIQVALVYPLIQGRELDWPWWAFASMVAALPLLALFWRSQRAKERRGGSPLVPPELFRSRAFVVGLVVALMFFGAAFSPFFMLAIYLQNGLGFSALDSGLTTLASPIGTMITAVATAPLVVRLGPRLLTIGAAIAVVGQVMLVLTVDRAEAAGGILQFVPAMLVSGLGVGMVIAPVIDIVLARVPVAVAGSASGVLSTAHHLGVTSGVAVAGTIFFSQVTASALAGDGAPRAFGEGMMMSLWITVGMLVVSLLLTLMLPRRSRHDPRHGAMPASVPTAS
ncbi:MFS transporter [Nonomuraea aridisoli]|uniref:MFS transporter n=1 Tax=Nonomuraea aridisoli TaxID=2070368 RepID=A0A2W2E417_9ACTN|nr:MFS transporter [Nonomuraea aridisoli]PZG18732.1 MFS transporter [Nonomuraea aridisoli]